MGIIKNFKVHGKIKLVEFILQAIEDQLVTDSTTALDISSKVNALPFSLQDTTKGQ